MLLNFTEVSGNSATYGLERGAPLVELSTEEVEAGKGFASGKELCCIKVTGPGGRLALASVEARMDRKGRVVLVLVTNGPVRCVTAPATVGWVEPVGSPG
jgi:hypothetical protein